MGSYPDFGGMLVVLLILAIFGIYQLGSGLYWLFINITIGWG